MKPSEALLHRHEVLAIIARYPARNPQVFGCVARGDRPSSATSAWTP